MTRATRHVCGAAPCLGVADVAGSVIGHAGDVACAQTKTFAQRSREQSHTQQLESAPGLDKGSQDRDNTHTGACMRAHPCLQACVWQGLGGSPATGGARLTSTESSRRLLEGVRHHAVRRARGGKHALRNGAHPSRRNVRSGLRTLRCGLPEIDVKICFFPIPDWNAGMREDTCDGTV